MTESDQGAAGAAPAQTEADSTPEFSLQSVYLKDCSFEAPKGPRVDGEWNPQISLDLNTAAETISPELREVVLTISVAAKNGENTAFLVEVKQAGVFGVRNLNEADYRRAFAAVAPGRRGGARLGQRRAAQRIRGDALGVEAEADFAGRIWLR